MMGRTEGCTRLYRRYQHRQGQWGGGGDQGEREERKEEHRVSGPSQTRHGEDNPRSNYIVAGQGPEEGKRRTWLGDTATGLKHPV